MRTRKRNPLRGFPPPATGSQGYPPPAPPRKAFCYIYKYCLSGGVAGVLAEQTLTEADACVSAEAEWGGEARL